MQMDKTDNILKILDESIKVYQEHCYNHLEEIAEEIKEEFIRVFNLDKTTYNLVLSNSVYKVDLFKIEARVKSDESLEEKMKRKNLIFELISEIGITDIESETPDLEKIKEYFFKFEDIIGIKILTELTIDCKNAFDLVNNNKENFSNITFKDIEFQPTQMKNGLSIYNIKAGYRDLYSFELQLKSKINSAWGDLDHTTFYKNSTFSPIRDSVQNTMNHIGSLLNEIEGLLHSLRSANNVYEEKMPKIKFTDGIFTLFSKEVDDKFKYKYPFDEKSDVLYFIYLQLTGQEIYHNTGLQKSQNDYYYFPLDSTDDFLSHYLSFRNRNFDAAILENIYLQWIEIYKNIEVKSSDFESILNEYLQMIVRYLVNGLNLESDPDLGEEYTEKVNGIIGAIIKHTSSIDVLVSVRSYDELFLWSNIARDDYSSEISEEAMDTLDHLWGVKIFKGKIKTSLEENSDYVPQYKDLLTKMLNDISPKTDRKFEKFKKLNIELMKEIDEYLEAL